MTIGLGITQFKLMSLENLCERYSVRQNNVVAGPLFPGSETPAPRGKIPYATPTWQILWVS